MAYVWKKFRAYIRSVRIARRHFKNWYTVILRSLLGLSCRAIFRGGGTVIWNARELLKRVVWYETTWLSAGEEAFPISVVNTFVVSSLFGFTYKIPFNYFMNQALGPIPAIAAEYQVDVNGKVVLDIGAYIGDSALYFLSKGAIKVVAVEPVPEHFEILKLNAEGRPIIAINAAVGCRIPYLPEMVGSPSYGVKEMKNNKNVVWLGVPVLRLTELVRMYNPEVVKIDCEGCEYFIIDEIIKLREIGVKQVIIELHNRPGKIQDILDVLKRELGEPHYIRSSNTKALVSWVLKHSL